MSCDPGRPDAPAPCTERTSTETICTNGGGVGLPTPGEKGLTSSLNYPHGFLKHLAENSTAASSAGDDDRSPTGKLCEALAYSCAWVSVNMLFLVLLLYKRRPLKMLVYNRIDVCFV